jgi:hypothetical protein
VIFLPQAGPVDIHQSHIVVATKKAWTQTRAQFLERERLDGMTACADFRNRGAKAVGVRALVGEQVSNENR